MSTINKFFAQVIVLGTVVDDVCKHINKGKLDEAYAKESGLKASDYMKVGYMTFESDMSDVASQHGIAVPTRLKGKPITINTNENMEINVIFDQNGIQGIKFGKYRNAVNGVEGTDWKKVNVRKQMDSKQNEVEVYDILLLNEFELVGTAIKPVAEHEVWQKISGVLTKRMSTSSEKDESGNFIKKPMTSRSVKVFMYAEEFDRVEELLESKAASIKPAYFVED